MTHNSTPVPGTEERPVYLTPVEIALLGDIGDPEVRVFGRYSPENRSNAYRIQRAPTLPIKNVTSKVTKLINLGLAEKGAKDGPSVSANFEIQLTKDGREHLEELASADA